MFENFAYLSNFFRQLCVRLNCELLDHSRLGGIFVEIDEPKDGGHLLVHIAGTKGGLGTLRILQRNVEQARCKSCPADSRNMFDEIDLIDIANLLASNHIQEAGKLFSRALRTSDRMFEGLLPIDCSGTIIVESVVDVVKLSYGRVPGQRVRG